MSRRSAGSNDYINNFLQPFMADGTTYTHDQFIRLLITTLDRQLKARPNRHCPRRGRLV
jgi:hypothetical protein